MQVAMEPRNFNKPDSTDNECDTIVIEENHIPTIQVIREKGRMPLWGLE